MILFLCLVLIDIVGTLDFSCRTVRCVQVSVTLQCEEILHKPSEETITAASPTASTVPGNDKFDKIMSFTVSKHHEVCVGLLQTQMILPVPLHVTPTFSTALGKLLEPDGDLISNKKKTYRRNS